MLLGTLRRSLRGRQRSQGLVEYGLITRQLQPPKSLVAKFGRSVGTALGTAEIQTT